METFPDRVLVVEDSKSIRLALTASLESVCGVETLAARTCEEARSALEAHGPDLFLAILDLALPDAMHGEIVDHAAALEIPFLVFTSTFDVKLRETLLSKGAIDYVLKGHRSVEEVVGIVRRLQRNRQVRLLVVDDSRSAREGMRSSLERQMFQVLTAADGAEALEVLDREEGVDLILTDYEMPVMNGLELVAELRRRFGKEELAVIGVSSVQDETLAARFLKTGANDFMRKPLGPEEFCHRVLHHVETVEHVRQTRDLVRRLAESERHERTLVENAPIGIFRSTPGGRFLSANTSLARMYGYDSPKDLMESIRDIGAQLYVDQEERAMVLDALKNGPIERIEVRRRRKDGSAIWVALSMLAVPDEDGKTLHYEGFVRDISKRREAEAMREHIERIIRHDLRTPVSSALNVAGLLRDADNLSADQLRLLDALEDSGRRMLDILNSSLELHRIETGQDRIRVEPVDCADLVRNMLRVFALSSEFEGVRMEFLSDGAPVPSDRRCPCLGHSSLLQTVLQNLLQNALEASPPGSTVTVALSAGAECRIEVANTGAVPPEIRETFFEKYVTSGKFKGTGLGTYSARLMVRAMGGEIAMRASDEENRTVVTVTLPPA